MNQQTLALDHRAVVRPDHTDPMERAGFALGWDHAHHGLVPPPGLLLEGTPVGQGWRAGKAVYGHRTLGATASVRQWLVLRTRAWRAGIEFDAEQLGPQGLAELRVDRCPVLRQHLGGASGDARAPAFERLNPQLGYVPGNVALMSRAAAQARASAGIADAVRHARRIDAGADPVDGLDAPAWWRVAALQSFATPLTFGEVARLPLAALPPPGVRPANPVQGLQALLTLQFASPGWSERLRTVAERLPLPALRQDYNLWVGAMVPRVLEASPQRRNLRLALEDAWLAERVSRRWQHFVLSLGEAGVEALLARLADAPLPACVSGQQAPRQAAAGTRGAAAPAISADGSATVAPPASRRRTGRTPSRPVPRATTALRPSAR
jgi:hypothetical protein